MDPQRPPQSDPQPPSALKTLGSLGNLGFQIAVPLVLFVLLGQWLDERYLTSPAFLLGGVALSLVTTTLALIRKIKDLTTDSSKKS